MNSAKYNASDQMSSFMFDWVFVVKMKESVCPFLYCEVVGGNVLHFRLEDERTER